MVDILGNDCPDGREVEKEVAETEKTFKELKRKLNELVEKCDQEIAQAKIFSDAVSELEDWTESAEDTRALRAPVARSSENIRKQLNEIEVSSLLVSKCLATLVMTNRYLNCFKNCSFAETSG